MDERPCVLRRVALAHGEPQWVKVQVEMGHARVHGGAQLVAMGGVFRVTENVASPPLGDRARDPHGHGGVTAAQPS
jgi:hypothetical protein